MFPIDWYRHPKKRPLKIKQKHISVEIIGYESSISYEMQGRIVNRLDLVIHFKKFWN